MARPRSLNPLVHLSSRVSPQVKAALEVHALEHECTVGSVIERMCRQAGILQTPQTTGLSEPGTRDYRVEAVTTHATGGNLAQFVNRGGGGVAGTSHNTVTRGDGRAVLGGRVREARIAALRAEQAALTPNQVRDTINLDQTWVATQPEWPLCTCGTLHVAPGTRIELAGISHGDTPCFSIAGGYATQPVPEGLIPHHDCHFDGDSNGLCTICGHPPF